MTTIRYSRYRVYMPQDAMVNARPRARSFISLQRAKECAASFYHQQAPSFRRYPVHVVSGSGSDYRDEGFFGERGWVGNILAGYACVTPTEADYGQPV